MIVLRGSAIGYARGDEIQDWTRKIGGHQRSGENWTVSVVTDRTYHVSETGSGIVIHDGRIETWGDDPLRWSGSFLALEPTTGGLRMISDRLGTIPLFWARVGGGCVFASRLVDLLALRDFGPDRVGILQTAMANHPVGQRTVLAGVSLAPPASVFDLTAEGLQERRRYWIPSVVHGGERQKPEQRLEEGIAVLRGASERALRGREEGGTAWPVTGGADSRCCLALNKGCLGAHDVLYHVTELGEHELGIARTVAAEMGLVLEVFDPTNWIRGAVEGAPDLGADSGELHVGQWFLGPAAEILAEQFGCRRVVDGYLLDTLLKPSMILTGTTTEVRECHLFRARYRLSRFGLSPESPVACDALAALAADFPDDDDGMAASQRFTLENRSRRMVFGHARMQANHLDVRVPGLDSELIDFAFALPWAYRRNGWLYRRIIGAVDPALGRIAHERTGRPLASDRSAPAHRDVLWLLRYYANRAYPGPDPFPGKETRFERMLRRDVRFRSHVYDRIGRSEWLAEAMGRGCVAALERQRRGGSLVSEAVGNMLHVALLEAYAATVARGEEWRPSEHNPGRATS